LNALAALAVAHAVGVPAAEIAAALASFHGTRRRFQVVGEAGGVTVVDDYGHHPTEIRATLAAARQRYADRRLVVAFQPHTFTRTKHLFQDFTRCFVDADILFLLDIYAARESDDLGVSARDLAAATTSPTARYAGGLAEAAATLSDVLRPGDVLVTIGAGDIEGLGPEVLSNIARGRGDAGPASASGRETGGGVPPGAMGPDA
jgi:UDP-N-acetylmuramate--alanine ligase